MWKRAGRRAIACLVAVLTVLGLLGIASAKGKRPKVKTVRVVILPVQVKGLSAEVGKELGAVVVGELRDIGVFQVAPGKMTWNKLNQLKKKRVFKKDCIEKQRCIQQVGRALRAKVIYHMEVAKADEGVRLRMRTFDVKSGQEVRESAELSSEEPADLERASRWLARRVSSPMITMLAKGKGRLQVNCDEPDAELYLNGKSFGKRLGRSFKVSSGVFDIMVNKEGYQSFQDVVVVKPGDTRELNAVLQLKGETAPLEVAGITPEETEEEAAEEKKEGRKPDLPPWAIFEKKEPKALETEKKEPEATGGKKEEKEEKESTAALMPWQQVGESKAYLPDKEKEPEPIRRKETKFYETWWFWTVTGVVVAGAGGTAVWYFLLRGEESSEYGAAKVTWQ